MASVQGLPSNLGRSYEVQLTVFSPDLYPQEASVTFDEIEAAFSDDFVKALRIAVKAALRKVTPLPPSLLPGLRSCLILHADRAPTRVSCFRDLVLRVM